jgi:hypothetical protein
LSVNRCLLPAWRKGTLVFFEGDLYLWGTTTARP